MARIKRRRRVRCKLPCEIVMGKAKRLPGRVVTLSEGGFAVVTSVPLDQGDPIRVEIDPKGTRPIKVSAIVWNDTEPSSAAGRSKLHRLGCVLSTPSDSFMSLLERMLPPEETPRTKVAKDHSDTIPVAKPAPQAREDDWAEPDLPRSRELQPPPKAEPEESLPYFRIRLKQIGGPRTRIMTLRARSATQAEQRALEELGNLTTDAVGWGVLHIAKVGGTR